MISSDNYFDADHPFSIGQNDSSTNSDLVYDENLRAVWKRKYISILKSLREKYKKAYFILSTSILFHDTVWDDMVEEIRKGIDDERVKTYRYKRLGKGTPGHIRRSEAQEMTEELALFIQKPDNPWGE